MSIGDKNVAALALPKREQTKLTDDEKKAYLDARIRQKFSWRCIPVNPTDPGVGSKYDTSEAGIQKAAIRIHDDIVSGFGYNQFDLEATRAVKFGIGYVAKVIAKGVADGIITTEQAVKHSVDTFLTEGNLPKGWKR
jgi:hypothetical protein